MKHSVRILLLPLAWAAAARGAAPEQAPLPDPLDLKGAVVYALDHNYDILQAREQIREQEGVILQVQGPGLPNLGGTASYQRNSESTQAGLFNSTSNWMAELKATQTLFAGGGVHASVKNARLARDAALAGLQATVDSAILDVRTRFYAVILAREKVRVQEENVRLYEKQLADTQNQFKAGSVSNFEVLRAQVSLANAQPDLITARNDYRIAVEQLRQSLGAPPSRGPALFPRVEGSLEPAIETFDLESAVASAHDHRPELVRLAKLSEAGEQAVTVARSTYYPNVGLYLGYEWDGLHDPAADFGAVEVPSTTYEGHGWLGGVQSSWSIFDGRTTAGKVVQAKAQLRQARLSVAQEELAVDVEVRQAFSSWQEAGELLLASQKTVEQAVEALRLADARFKAGTATQLDVLTSQVSLTQARTNEVQANYTYLVSVATLRKAMGIGDALVGE